VRRRPALALAAAVVAAGASFAAPSGARASEATATQVRALALRAAGDPAALRALRAIDTVDGRPVDVAAALGDARGAALRSRLRVLAREAGTEAGAPADARRRARAVLSERRFRESLPQPFKGPLQRLGDWLQGLWNRLPGGAGGRWGLAIIAVAIVTAAVSLRGVRRRRGTAEGVAAFGGPGGLAAEGAAALESRADEAERAGDHALAVRLRFRAGLMRLGERDVIPYRPSLTTAEARRRLRSAPFDRLAADFDQITYGGRVARDDDARAAREGWREVLGAGAR
jgi:Domain of unknown function (DUF4129)